MLSAFIHAKTFFCNMYHIDYLIFYLAMHDNLLKATYVLYANPLINDTGEIDSLEAYSFFTHFSSCLLNNTKTRAGKMTDLLFSCWYLEACDVIAGSTGPSQRNIMVPIQMLVVTVLFHRNISNKNKNVSFVSFLLSIIQCCISHFNNFLSKAR